MSRRVDPIRGCDATVSPSSTEASRQRGPPARVTPPIKRGNSDRSETDSRHVKKSIHGPQLADLSTFSVRKRRRISYTLAGGDDGRSTERRTVVSGGALIRKGDSKMKSSRKRNIARKSKSTRIPTGCIDAPLPQGPQHDQTPVLA